MPFKNHKSEGSANIMQKQGQSSILCAMALLLSSFVPEDTSYTEFSSGQSSVKGVPRQRSAFSFSIPSVFIPHILQKKKQQQQYLRIQQPNAKQASSGIPTESQEGLRGSGLFPKKEKCKKKELRKLLCLNPWINRQGPDMFSFYNWGCYAKQR